MTSYEVRIELLRQHADLRHMIGATREIAGRAQEGESLRQQLQASVLRLAAALGTHNQREEELLRSVTTSDGWPRSATESLNQRHFEEHKALHAALVEVTVDPNVRWVARHLGEALDTIVEHMAHEESTFLNQGVLSDDERDTDPPPGSPVPGT
jgi:hypothetical protein